MKRAHLPRPLRLLALGGLLLLCFVSVAHAIHDHQHHHHQHQNLQSPPQQQQLQQEPLEQQQLHTPYLDHYDPSASPADQERQAVNSLLEISTALFPAAGKTKDGLPVPTVESSTRVVPYRPQVRSYARLAFRPSIKEQIAEQYQQSRKDRIEFWDPLKDVLLAGKAPQRDRFITSMKQKLEASRNDPKKGGVQWLDTKNDAQRSLVAHIYGYCSSLFISKGVERDCFSQCHKPVECGTQAARFCQSLKSNYNAYVQCVDREGRFCERYGAFNGEKYPNFQPEGNSEMERTQSVILYCGDFLQMRGITLPCLRRCTIFTTSEKNPTAYYMWRARNRALGGPVNERDPVKLTADQETMRNCERVAYTICRFELKPFWDYCYKHSRSRCMRRVGTGINPVLGYR